MNVLNNMRSKLPSASLMLHYTLIALLLCAMGGSVVWYSHVERVMTTVDRNAEQVIDLADGLLVEPHDSPKYTAKLYRIQLEAIGIKSAAKTGTSTSTSR